MANEVNSIYMSLPVPVVGIDPGPQYAIDVNSCLTIIDQHSHLPGSGIPIVSGAININADLPFNNNNLTSTRALRFQAQTVPIPATGLELDELYVAGVDLWYNDGAGNQVRITAAGGVAGTPGSISNLTPPASASYVSANETFVWQSAANTPANLDAASIVLRNLIANSFGLTLSPPTLGSNYTITLPQLPGTTLPLSITSLGVIGAAQITTSQIANQAITSTQIANQTIAQGNLALRSTGTTVPPGGVAVSTSSGGYTNVTGTPATVVTCTITTTGRPVFIGLVADGSSNSFIQHIPSPSGAALISILNGSTVLSTVQLSNPSTIIVPPGVIYHVDFPLAGTYTYNLTAVITTAGTVNIEDCLLIAYEL